MIEPITGKVLCTANGKGKEHDFCLFKRSRVRPKSSIELLGDKGYQGIQKVHAKSQTPQKRKRHKPLSQEAKKSNQELAQKRICIEHIFRHLKIFRILAERYRNRRKRLGLRFNLIAGFYNYEIQLQTNN